MSSVEVNPVDGAQMIFVPAGEFWMGSDEWSNEKPQRKVYLDGYWIYKTLVTVARYRTFCRETNRDMPQKRYTDWQDNHPIVHVTWFEATAYAQWVGGSVPTEAQWEKAARGTDGRVYPWGNEWDAGKCRCSVREYGDAGGTAPVGSYPLGASPYGCLDMAGNVWEWCADWYDEGYYKCGPGRAGGPSSGALRDSEPTLPECYNPMGPERGNRRVLRGGAWDNIPPALFRAANRDCYPPAFGKEIAGFRCVSRADSR